MNKTTYSLLDPFKIGGHWWLPDRPGNSVPGTLSYSPDEIVLVTHGSLDEPDMAALGVVSNDFDRFSHIHGIFENGHPCTLLNVTVTARRHNLQRITRSEYSAIYLIVGCHSPDPGAIRFKSQSLACTHLHAFVHPNVFHIERHDTGTPFQGVTVTYTVPPQTSVRVSAIGATLEIGVPLSYTCDATQVALRAESCIAITPDTPQSLEWYVKQTWHLRCFLSLLTDERVRLTQSQFITDDGESEGWLLYRHSRPYLSKGKSFPVLLFHFAHLHERFQDICDKWFSVGEVLLSAIHLFMDGFHNRDGTLSGRFLILSQALEAFSRATTSSEYMPPDDYETLMSSVVAAIPAKVGSDHRASLKNRIKYGNEFSLRKRVTTLLDSLSVNALACICKSPDDFVGGVVDTRNYFTHYTDELRPNALREAELLWMCERMTMLLRVLLLRELGIEEELIVQRISGHPRLMQYMQLQKNYRERVT